MRQPQAKIPDNPKELSQTAYSRWARKNYHKDIELSRQNQRALHQARTPAEKLERIWKQLARPSTPIPGSVNSRNTRKVALANAHCVWSDSAECYRTYLAAAVMSELFGRTYVVDHTVPLNNPLVCGLHTHDNLRAVPEGENAAKSNTFWPQMWPIDWETYLRLTQSD